MSVSTCDPLQLDNLATCFRCYNADALAIKTYLLCQTLNIATPPCVTPSAPTSTGFKSKTDTTIRISWFQPANSGSLITSYTIKWGTVTGVYTNSATVGISPKLYTITGLTQGTQYFWVIQANSFAGCSSANSAESNTTTSGASPTNGLLNGLVSYWQIDGALGIGHLGDDSQDGNPATVTGGVNNPAGGLFVGTGDFGSAGNGRLNITPAPANLKLGNGASFTFQTWVKGGNFAAGQGTFGGQYDATQAGSSWLLFASVGAGKVIGFSTDASQKNLTSAALVADGATWNHVIVGYDSSIKTLFMQANGAARQTVVTSADLNSVATAFQMCNDTTNEPFTGAMTQSAFWNRALSTTDVANLYNGGAGLPFSSYQA